MVLPIIIEGKLVIIADSSQFSQALCIVSLVCLGVQANQIVGQLVEESFLGEANRNFNSERFLQNKSKVRRKFVKSRLVSRDCKFQTTSTEWDRRHQSLPNVLTINQVVNKLGIDITILFCNFERHFLTQLFQRSF
jgi:hypothetical protein